MAAHTHDDGFHEIQLNGKQLVFLFMAATVVSVVIFLCGVLVGRGVRAERMMVAAQAEALAEPTADHAAPASVPPQPAADVTKADAPPVADELSAPNRLDKPNRAVDEVKPDPPKTAAVSSAAIAVAKAAQEKPATPEKTTPVAPKPAPTSAKPPAATPTTAAAAPKPAVPAPGSADAGGFAVQVAAVNVRSEADAIAKRLASKGYATYVQAPTGSGNIFRVRVGTFKTRREAETVAARLEKEEQIKPWVTR